MNRERQDSFIELTLTDVDKDDVDYKILQKLANSIHISLVNKGAEGVGIFRESFSDIYTGGYYVKENGSGTFQGLFKVDEGVPISIRPALVGEIALLRGSGTLALIPPKGWQIISDIDIQSRYNIGASPNWKVVAIEYIGV